MVQNAEQIVNKTYHQAILPQVQVHDLPGLEAQVVQQAGATTAPSRGGPGGFFQAHQL